MTNFKQIPEAHLEPAVWSSVEILTRSGVMDKTDQMYEKLPEVNFKWYHRVTQPVTNSVYNESFLGSYRLVKDTRF
jgi:hypothetical protein